MKSIHVSDETAHRLRVFIASENMGKTYGKIGATAENAINHYIYEKEKYIDDLAREAMEKSERSSCIRPRTLRNDSDIDIIDPPSEYN